MKNENAATPSISHELHNKRQIKNVIDAILYGQTPEVTRKDGRNALVTVLVLYESCKKGKPVKVDVMA